MDKPFPGGLRDQNHSQSQKHFADLATDITSDFTSNARDDGLQMNSCRSLVVVVLAALVAACASPESNINSGFWHYNAGLYGQAMPRLVSAIPALEASEPADPRVVTGYLALGRMASTTDAPPGAAEAYFSKALNAAHTHHAGDLNISRNAASEAGNYYLQQNFPAKALPLLQQAAEISERSEFASRMLHAVDLDNVAVAQATLKNYAIANRYSDLALQVLDKLPSDRGLMATRGVILFNRAYSDSEQGLSKQADERYRRALELISANAEPWRKRVVVSSYAKFLRSQGRENEARAVESQ